MQHTEQPFLSPPSLPDGGGAITGLKGAVESAGPDGGMRPP